MTDVLSLDDVALTLDGHVALDGFTLRVAEGERVALLGPSGCGKTSALRSLLGLAIPQRGVVRIAGETASADGRAIVQPERRGLAVVFQDLALWPHLSVHGNLAFGLESRRVARAERERRIAAMLDRVGLADRARARPGELSGGERQRVALARALVLEPRAVLLDEPLTSLDVVLRRELLAWTLELLRERRATALYVTHEPREAAAIADRVVVMERGKAVQSGSIDAIRARPATPFVASLLEELA